MGRDKFRLGKILQEVKMRRGRNNQERKRKQERDQMLKRRYWGAKRDEKDFGKGGVNVEGKRSGGAKC